MRKLASIQKILSLDPIPNADAIEVAQVLGWRVVVKKGDFKVNDLCLYCEIDSVLPDNPELFPEFQFLKEKKFRIRTIKLKGQVSQGICFPLSVMIKGEYVGFKEGDDITQIIGVKLYEPEIPAILHGLIEGHFPSYLIKTDEIRIQSEPKLLEEFKNLLCYATVKLDGTSSTFSHYNGEIKICGRNWAYKPESKNVYIEIFKRYDLGNRLQGLGNFAIQGEICGPGIQGNPLKLKQIDFYAFNIYDIDKKQYVDYFDFINFCNRLEVKTVPILSSFIFDHTIEQLLEMAKGYYENTTTPREGIVIRSVFNMYSYVLGGRLSVKVINNDYLLKVEK